MSIHFHPLVIKEIRRETPDCVSLLFEVPETLAADFRFTQGQNLTLRTRIGGQDIRRSYSICSAPFENQLRVAIKKVHGGVFSVFANEQLKPGDLLEVMPPVGKFFVPLEPERGRHYLAIAAGSGITPILSIIKTVLHEEPKSRVTLVYGNRNRSSIIFGETLEGIKNNYLDRFNLVPILSRERTDAAIHTGRIDRSKLEELARLIPYRHMDEVFICGPEAMIFESRDYLVEKGVDARKIHFELFTTRGSAAKSQTRPLEETKTGASASVTVQLDGRSFDFSIPFSSPLSLLDAALQQGADLPFACKGGMCCTCKARLTEGDVSMDVHWGLDEEELAKGFILTCQSHPRSEKIRVDFDQR